MDSYIAILLITIAVLPGLLRILLYKRIAQRRLYKRYLILRSIYDIITQNKLYINSNGEPFFINIVDVDNQTKVVFHRNSFLVGKKICSTFSSLPVRIDLYTMRKSNIQPKCSIHIDRFNVEKFRYSELIAMNRDLRKFSVTGKALYFFISETYGIKIDPKSFFI